MTAPRPPAAVLAAAPALTARPVAAPARRSDALVAARGFAVRLSQQWVPALAWRFGRTGRAGLAGLALLIASLLFLFSTHLPVTGEIERLRADVAAARAAAAAPSAATVGPVPALRSLPARTQMPAVLGELLKLATAARLSIDTGKYEVSSTKAGSVTRYKVSFPVSGPYPQVREFLDETLRTMPAVAISDLSFERKSIADAAVEAQVRLTIFARSAP